MYVFKRHFCYIFFLQTLTSLLHCHTLEEVQLSGRDMFSLKELVLNKSSQVSEYYIITKFSTYCHSYVAT